MSRIAELTGYTAIGLAVAWLAGRVRSVGGFGVAADRIGAVLGALLGGFLFRTLGAFAVGLPSSLLAAAIGAIVVLSLIRLIKRA